MPLAAQDLAPRAYLVTAVHSNAITLTWAFYDGGLNFNGTIPVTGATGTYTVPTLSYYHSLDFFGRSANITVSLPYAVGTFSGNVLGQDRSIYRSGLLDFSARFSVNLLGGPARQPREFAKWIRGWADPNSNPVSECLFFSETVVIKLSGLVINFCASAPVRK
jgi:hypothetical protein